MCVGLEYQSVNGSSVHLPWLLCYRERRVSMVGSLVGGEGGGTYESVSTTPHDASST